jgi:hypothetical protein
VDSVLVLLPLGPVTRKIPQFLHLAGIEFKQDAKDVVKILV